MTSGILLAVSLASALACSTGIAGPKKIIKTAKGSIVSIDTDAREIKLLDTSRHTRRFKLEEATSLIFEGLHPMRIESLKPGMNVEIDYHEAASNELPLVTWVEILKHP